MKKKGQVWVETVIYTLIALALIGTVLAFVRPQIQKMQDKAIIDQSLEMIGELDSKILQLAQGGVGNQRIIELQIKKGELEINPEENSLIFILDDTKYIYSEIGKEIKSGNIEISTTKKASANTVKLKRIYENYDLVYEGGTQPKTLTKSPTVYKIKISNKGVVSGDDKIQINFELAS